MVKSQVYCFFDSHCKLVSEEKRPDDGGICVIKEKQV